MYDLNLLFKCLDDQIKNGKKLKELQYLVSNYKGNDWINYAFFNKNKYNKNTIYCNNLIELAIISWNNNQNSGIHDHPKNGCIMKIIYGELNEYIYQKNNNELNLIDINYCMEDSIGYQEGSGGIHNIINCDCKTVSLHVYSPPNYKFYKYS